MVSPPFPVPGPARNRWQRKAPATRARAPPQKRPLEFSASLVFVLSFVEVLPALFLPCFLHRPKNPQANQQAEAAAAHEKADEKISPVHAAFLAAVRVRFSLPMPTSFPSSGVPAWFPPLIPSAAQIFFALSSGHCCGRCATSPNGLIFSRCKSRRTFLSLGAGVIATPAMI